MINIYAKSKNIWNKTKKTLSFRDDSIETTTTITLFVSTTIYGWGVHLYFKKKIGKWITKNEINFPKQNRYIQRQKADTQFSICEQRLNEIQQTSK